MEKKLTTYAMNESCLKRLASLTAEIDELSRAHNLPFFFTAAVANDESHTEYITKCRSALPFGIQLTNDQLVEHLKVCRGFRTYATETLPDINLG